MTLEFTLTNTATTGAITGISFTDDLDGVLPGLAAVGLPLDDVCGAGSLITGTGFLSFTGGSLGADEDCTFPVDVAVPANAPLGTVTNVTSQASATFDGLATTSAPATDDLTVAEAVCTAPDGENAVLANDSLFEPPVGNGLRSDRGRTELPGRAGRPADPESRRGGSVPRRRLVRGQ